MGDLANRFTYHAPGAVKVNLHQRVREILLTAAQELDDVVRADVREKSLMLTKLEEAMFWANAAIARYPHYG